MCNSKSHTVSRRSLERETKRRYVLAAARRLFAEKGMDGTRMEEIATAANYTRRTLYSFFKSRDEVCLLMLHEDDTRRWEFQKAAMDDADTGLAKIEAWAMTLFDFMRENPQTLQLQAYWDYRGMDRSRISPEIFVVCEVHNDEMADGLRAIFTLGIEDGSLRPDLEVDLCISQFIYTLRAAIHRALSTTYSFADFDAEPYVCHYLDLFNRSIRNQEG